MVNDVNLNKIRLPLILIFYFSLSFYFLFIKDFQYLIDPDSTSYISIALKYLQGYFPDAINGHFSPMASWLLLPLLIIKIKPLLALELTAIIAGGFTLTGINLLLYTLGVREHIRFLYVLALVPLITLYALTEGNPDLLCVAILIYYLYILLRTDFKTDKYGGIFAGLLGAVAYLSKSYNFYFFLLHFSFSILFFWFNSPDKAQRRALIFNGLSGLLVFLLISSSWIGLLTNKYHTLTVSTAGSYNFSFTRPGSSGQMVDTDGLLAPTNNTAISAWEDPTYIEKPAWSPFESSRDFQYFIRKTVKNAVSYFLYISRNHIIFFTLIYCFVILLPLQLRYPDNAFYLFLTTLLHPIGYLMLLVEDRYFWIDYVLLYILSAYILDDIIRRVNFKRIQKFVLLSVVIFYIAIIPILHINNFRNNINKSKGIYLLSEEIKKYHDFHNVNIASQVENWSDDLYLSYYLQARYFGKVQDGITDNQLKKKLKSLGIQYYFVHGKLKNHLDILKLDNKFDEISIYKIAVPDSKF